MRNLRRAVVMFGLIALAGGLIWGSGSTDQSGAATTGAAVRTGKYGEAPMLAALVQAGQLPSVEKRLPNEPLVRAGEAVGKYGGTLRTFNINPNSWGDMQEAPDYAALLTADDKTGQLIGDVALGFTQAADGKSITVTLREGMKWSSGDPLTYEDVAFMYEIQKEQKVGNWGGIGTGSDNLVKIDDYTFRIEFNTPRFPFVVGMAAYTSSDWGGMISANYYKKWHLKYNPDADKIAKEKGFETWIELMSWSLPFGGITKDFSRPTLNPFVLKSFTGDLKIFERNPYYHGVDTAGNQLPYVDKIQTQIVDAQTYHLKVAAGEADLAYYTTNLDNITLYKENEARGNYKVTFIPGTASSEMNFMFNPLDPDPAKARALGNKKFRQALSLAINRDEINQAFYQGLAVPMQATANPNASFYKKSWGESYAKYDPAAANKLLDEIGLDKKDKDGYRIGYDGNTLNLAVEYDSSFDAKKLELVREYWAKVGVKVQLVAEDRALWRSRRGASLYSIAVEAGPSGLELLSYSAPSTFAISVLYWGPWDAWMNAERDIKAGVTTLDKLPDGKMPGVQPPQEVIDVRRAFEARSQTKIFSPEYTSLSQKAFDLHAENLWFIGTVGYSPVVVVAKNTLGNVPRANRKTAEYAASLNYYGPLVYYK